MQPFSEICTETRENYRSGKESSRTFPNSDRAKQSSNKTTARARDRICIILLKEHNSKELQDPHFSTAKGSNDTSTALSRLNTVSTRRQGRDMA